MSDSLNYRSDKRTSKQFSEDISHFSKKEEKYLKDFLKRRNEKSKQENIKWRPLGSSTEVNLQSGKEFDKPDFLIVKYRTSSHKVKDIWPVEVQTSTKQKIENGFIKIRKLEKEFRKPVKKIPDAYPDELYLLFIKGKEGTKKYHLFTPQELEYIADKCPIVKPACFGKNKPAYKFSIDEYAWKELYPES